MAATLFADPPVATMEEAREHFVAAETLKPDGWIENRQFLAKCNINLQVRKGMYKTPPVNRKTDQDWLPYYQIFVFCLRIDPQK